MKVARSILVFLLFSSLSKSVFAQDIVIIGQVLNADSVPLEAANVWFPGTRLGASTNAEGFFMLRSPVPQRALSISMVGYQRQRIKLDYGHDAMFTIVMQEDFSVLNEIVIGPTNQALELMKAVYARHHGRPMLPIDRQVAEQINMTDLPNHLMQRRLFRDISSGAIDRNDTTFSLPAYSSLRREMTSAEPDYLYEHSLPLFTATEWRALASSYSPRVNLYNPYVTILGNNFVSPVCRQPGAHYRFFLVDSLHTDSTKTYTVRVKPKYNFGNYFVGTLVIDSASARIVGSDLVTAPSSNVPLFNRFCFSHCDTVSQQSLSLAIDPLRFRNTNLFGLMLFSRSQFINPEFEGDTLQLPDHAAEMDSLQKSPFFRLVYFVTDLLITQYFHAGPIDIGPVLNIFHYNRFDGATPLIPIRTNARMLRQFTIGGYVGYAHGAHKWIYGGNMQWTSRRRNHTVGLFYDHKSYRIGLDEQYVFNENKVEDPDNLAASLSTIKAFATNTFRTQIRARYTYENRFGRTGLRVIGELQGQRIMMEPDVIDNLNLRADFRLSWDEQSLRPYFARYYLKTRYPVVHIYGEAGHYSVGSFCGHYGRVGIYAHQNLPVGFGRFMWTARASKLFGRVPYPLLDYVRSTVSSFNMNNDMTLVAQTEFAADALFTATLRYQTRGFIFGYIPVVQRMGIREDLYLNIAYGLLSQRHEGVLGMAEHTQPWGKVPYIEAGFGLSNIFSLFRVQFMFRCTYRSNPDAELFRVRWAVEI